MRKITLLFVSMLLAAGALQAQSVNVVYAGDTATVTMDSLAERYLTLNQQGAHVSIAQADSLATEITYNLRGTTTDGEFYMSGSFKATIELAGLELTNATPVYSGAAVHIQNGKRINVKVITETTNTLVDAATGSQKGCLYVKGHAEFKQHGTLNVVGNVKHAIKAGEYISLKNATINVTSAVGDGISCNQYFLMESGTINISGTADDGIQCDLEGDTATAITEDHEDEDSGNIYIEGGTININCAGIAAKGIKAQGDMNISGGDITVVTSGKGEWDTEDLETNSACGLSADGNINITGGTLSLTSTGSGGKGMKCDSVLTITGGDITVTTSGGLYYNNGTTENTNWNGNTDQTSSDYYSSPKGIKAGLKVEDGDTVINGRTVTKYAYSGGIVINGGIVRVTTSGRNAEGIESKNTLVVNGGEIIVNSYDDGINAAQDLTINGGYIYSRASNNDGLDANGNLYINGGLVYAIGARSPELAIDANSEEGKKVFIYGGVIIAVGGIENGASYNQPYIQQNSLSSNTWYTVTYGDSAVAFLTPTITSGGGGFPGGGGPGGNSNRTIISAPSTPTLASGNTITGGISILDGNCYVEDNGGGTTGIYDIDEEATSMPKIIVQQGRILVESSELTQVYDLEGRLIQAFKQSNNQSLPAGVYLVKVGSHPAKKVVVTK